MLFKNIIKQIFFLCIALLISWILVHFLAIFGIFLALALPILHIMFYPTVMCFWCQITHTPHKFSHSVIDSFIILVVTAASIGIVYGESKVLSAFGFPRTSASVSFVIPDRNQYKLNEIFPMKIEIAGIQTPVNVVQADLGFDPTKLEVVDVTTDGSFASIFLQKEHDNHLGYVRLTGGIPNPGFSDKVGVFGTVYFRGISAGLAEVKFLDSSLVLANDGKGTNVLKDLATASYVILPESIPQKQIEEQSRVIIQQQVLGQSTDNTQITYYDQTQNFPKPVGQVLGVSTGIGQPAKVPAVRQSPIANFLARIDNTILRFWQSLKFWRK
jgi:hypothetical protein